MRNDKKAFLDSYIKFVLKKKIAQKNLLKKRCLQMKLTL